MGCSACSGHVSDIDTSDVSFLPFSHTNACVKFSYAMSQDEMILVFPFKGTFVKQRCRIFPLQKKLISVKDWLNARFKNEVINIRCYDFDEQGSLLVTLFRKDGTIIQ